MRCHLGPRTLKVIFLSPSTWLRVSSGSKWILTHSARWRGTMGPTMAQRSTSSCTYHYSSRRWHCTVPAAQVHQVLSRRLRRRREKLVLQPVRPPFFLTSDGLVGLGWEGNVWFSARLCGLGPSRCRVWCPGGACKVETARLQWNKVIQTLFHLAITSSGVGGGPMGWEFFGSGDRVGAPDLQEFLVEPDPVRCFIQV
jgi:hypothetical protein